MSDLDALDRAALDRMFPDWAEYVYDGQIPTVASGEIVRAERATRLDMALAKAALNQSTTNH